MAEQPSRIRQWTAPPEQKGPAAQVNELKDLVVGYAKQETVEPLKTLGRYLGFGFAGSLSLGLGLIFGLLALLRGLQQFNVFNDVTEVDGGRWSWVPYFLTAIVGFVIVGLFGMALNRALKQRERS